MLPILRILPVGGVFLAIMLLVLALNPPAGPHAQLTPNGAPVRGAMIDRNEHPEWRQFLILAAIRRAEELSRLRDLADIPAGTGAAPPAPKVAGLPATRGDTDPDDDDQTGSIVQIPAATLPIDIGETSTFELPVVTPEERPPVTPLRVKSRNESRLRAIHHARRVRAPVSVTPPPFNFLDYLFGLQPAKQPLKVGANTPR
ncbi:MAG TPA: hypothetical protein VFC45_03225 [Pseudolabrys sp.]|nr:hypothetical protein [Pseudolabrys sp.]